MRSLFLQKSPFSLQHQSPSPGPYAFRSPTPRKLQQPTAQLTIFYAGTVNVFDVPADKAKAIMMFAGNESSCFGHHSARTPTSMGPATPLISTPSRSELPSPSPGSISARVPLKLRNSPKFDLPMARKHSLQSFLEKRNKRLNARSPYAHH